MLQLAIWVTYRQTSSPAGISVPLLAVLPRSNAVPPDDGDRTWPPRAPQCEDVDVSTTPATTPTPTPTRDQVLAALSARLPSLDWQSSHFASAEPLSARWGVISGPDRGILCATQARSVFVFAKLALAVAGNVDLEGDAAGRWSTEWMQLLHRRAVTELGLRPEEIPFAPDATYWTRNSLAFLLWATFYRSLPSYESIMLATDVVLPPAFGVAAPDDGFGRDPLPPLCFGVSFRAPDPAQTETVPSIPPRVAISPAPAPAIANSPPRTSAPLPWGTIVAAALFAGAVTVWWRRRNT